jgi:hypothetical protein
MTSPEHLRRVYTDVPSIELDRRVVYTDRRRDPPRVHLVGIDTERLGLKLGRYRCRATLVHGDDSEIPVETSMSVSEYDTEPNYPPYWITVLLDAPDDFERLILTEFAWLGGLDEE